MRLLTVPVMGLAVALGFATTVVGCRSGDVKPLARAEAVLEAKSGSKLTGRAVFTRIDAEWIHVRIDVAGVAPGLHACHIHEKGDCSAADGSLAGGHWNPLGKKHGKWMQADGEFHLGDLGVIEVGADGRGSLEMTTPLFDMGCGCPKDIVGKSVMIHEKADDFTTQPTGAAGGRIGCGPIKAVVR